jgi:hypothetical protein
MRFLFLFCIGLVVEAYISRQSPACFAGCKLTIPSTKAACRIQATTLHAGPFFAEEEISNVSVRKWEGAGLPRPDLPPEDIPTLLMGALRMNDVPTKNAGLLSVWEFAGDTTRHIFEHNITDFIESAHETAATMATSFYGVAMNGKDWKLESPLNRVGGDDGWIATQVMMTVCSDGRVRRWQWELRKHKRPPNLGAWYVESIGSSDRKGNFEPE